MQEMDSSITKTQKRNLTDMQEKFLDVLFGEGYKVNRLTR